MRTIKTIWRTLVALWAAAVAGSAVGTAGGLLTAWGASAGISDAALLVLFVLAVATDVIVAVAVFRMVRRQLFTGSWAAAPGS